MAQEVRSEICQICKKEKIVGAIFMVSLREKWRNEAVVPGPSICDSCTMKLFSLLERLKLEGWGI